MVDEQDWDLDRATHLRRDLGFLEARLEDPGSLLVPVWRTQNLLAGEHLARPTIARAAGLLDSGGELVFLGLVDGAACFAVDISPLDEPLGHAALDHGHSLDDLRGLGARLPRPEAALAAYARAILYWHARHQHCGTCGHQTAPRDGGHMRECRNGSCGDKQFPRTDPAIIVLVSDGDRCLLGRQGGWPRGMYSTLAGFVEPGESVEQAVAREVHEESGVHVTDVRYFRSQPWPFPASLMLGFRARATSTEVHLGDDELEDARWVTRAEVAAAQPGEDFWVPNRHSLAGQLIGHFLEEVPGSG